MNNRLLFSLLLAACLAVAQSPAVSATDIPEAQLEAAHQANPDDLRITGRLIGYYGRENRDTAWSARFPLISWSVEHHPDAPFLGAGGFRDMPKPLRDQLKQLWMIQVQRHPDSPQILRNAAAAMDDAPTVIRVGGNVQQTNLIRQVRPEYPQAARDAGVQGSVRFTATIGQGGEIESLQLESGHPLLVQSAMNAVKQWRYKPTLLNGNPIAVIAPIEVAFTLNN